ncbi:vWA domain-containing protein [Skermania piniformis]|uniref:vWA domain-containing protein n=1 Tax=Skermania pinensis TaxID=39122 RepID=UPI000B02D611|nr:VWA domain-containing protein [Skermania piniformis]
MTPLPSAGLPEHLVGFVEALRDRGIPVGPSETVDAGHVLAVLDLLDRESVRAGLACALLRRPADRPTFDGLFDLWFPLGIGARTAESADPTLPRRVDGTVDIPALRGLIAELLGVDAAEQQALAAQLVDQLGRYESANGPSFSAYQALREVQLDSLVTRVMAAMIGGRRGSGDDEPDPNDLGDEVDRRLARQRIANFRDQVQAETRRRSAERQGRERVAGYGVPKRPDEVDFLRATEVEMARLRRTVPALARLLASRLAVRRRRARAGEIDLRRTLRASMSTGGVPIDLVRRKPPIGRPDLVVLCDVSGSVAGFSQFTMLLVSALREQFTRVRIFAFVDTTDEVTRYFDPGADLAGAMARMFADAALIRYDGHSDYGNALDVFERDWPDAATARSSLLILGDARTNYRDPRLDILAAVVQRVKQAHWLNPEPQRLWGSGDSAALRYRDVIAMHECRTAAQLTTIVGNLLPV